MISVFTVWLLVVTSVDNQQDYVVIGRYKNKPDCIQVKDDILVENKRFKLQCVNAVIA